MKTAAKVFIWIGLIGGAIFIFPLIIGIFALNKIDTATSKNDLVGMGVATLLLCSTLGGIFMLLITDEELNNTYNNKKQNSQNNQQSSENTTNSFVKPTPTQSRAESAMDRLVKLSKMKEENLITEEEYKQLKQEVLKEI